jgi:hydroxymethylpyrimidine/phosphomethylpyrimidine kinase
MTSRLFPLAAIVTPNLPEAERLTGLEIGNEAQIVRAAERLHSFGTGAVLIKGGHGKGEIVRDVLMSGDDNEIFEAPRIAGPAPHGTGCTLATAIACGLANELSLRDSVTAARDLVRAAIASGQNLGRGRQ